MNTAKVTTKAKSKVSEKPISTARDFGVLYRITERAFYMALRMIDIANHRPQTDKGEPKVGGHPSACASSQHILAAIHLVLRKSEDYFACKPHVSPMEHALNYLLHNFRDADGKALNAEKRELAMHHLRHYSPEGYPVFQSYHAEADPDSFRYFPSGSVGIPPVNALYTSLAYEFAKDHGFEIPESPTFWCLMGDSEFREGSLMEAMPDAGERGLRNLVWIVDYNRQNLDGTRVTNEKALNGSDADRIVRIAEANGWMAIKLKHGKKREKLFAASGGEEFRRVLDDEITDFELQALLSSKNPSLIRQRLESKSSKLKLWLKGYSEAEIYEAFTNLAGHDLESLVETFEKAKKSESRPVLVVAYTIKGLGLECAALSGNHSAMPEAEELDEICEKIKADPKRPFAEFPSSSPEEKYLVQRRQELLSGIDQILVDIRSRRGKYLSENKNLDWPSDFDIGALKFAPQAHTQWMWGQIAAKLDRLARGEKNTAPQTENDKAWSKVARFFLTMAPDVGSSTNTSPNMNGKIFGDIGQEDFEMTFQTKDTKAPDVIPKIDQRSGHLRFEIAEGNCMSAAGSFGKMGHFLGIPFYPAMTIYDFFIKRAHDQYYYNLYWKSSFATIGTPSGVTLAAEGAQHSWKSDFQIPNCVTWEPCYAKELEWILADTLRRHFTGDDFGREAALIRCVTKGLVQKDLLERARQQLRFKDGSPSSLNLGNAADFAPIAEDVILETIRQDALKGAYALVDYRGYDEYVPGDNAVHLFAMGALGPEALRASDALREKGILANVFIVTSPDLLLGNYAYQDGYAHLKEGLGINGHLYFGRNQGAQVDTAADWYSFQTGRVPIVSVHDGEPGLLDNIGSVVGVKQRALAIRKTSKSGTTQAVYHYHHIDPEGIEEAAVQVLKESAGERFVISKDVLHGIDVSG